MDKKLLEHPCLNLSAHLEKHRAAYYDSLTHVRQTNDLGHWIRFFLVAVIETSKNAIDTFRALFELRNRTTELLGTLGRAAPNATRIVDYLYQKPVITSQEISKQLSMRQSTTDRMITLLRDQGVLKELTGQRRNRVFIFEDYYRKFI